MDAETEFLSGLIELQYGVDVEDKLRDVADNVGWVRGWPKNKKAFWNAEAFMWGRKISKEKRALIANELRFLEGEKNLDVGCGAFSYVKESVGFDISSKMLDFNDTIGEKVVGDLEKELPFASESFDSVTAVLVVNYVKNVTGLFCELLRVLRDRGVFVMVLSSKKINEWQRQKEVTSLHFGEWKDVLERSGFTVEAYEEENVWFFRCRKEKSY